MTDLTDRMRTCAAYLLTTQLMRDYDAVKDAADLLLEASNELEQLHSTGALRIPHDLGEPMEIIQPNKPAIKVQADTVLPTGNDWVMRRQHNPHACPQCDSRAGKRVDRVGAKLMLTCPVCGERWEWKPKAEWR